MKFSVVWLLEGNNANTIPGLVLGKFRKGLPEGEREEGRLSMCLAPHAHRNASSFVPTGLQRIQL